MSTKSPSSAVVDEVIRSGPAQLLKSCAYRKLARSFSFQGEGIFRVVQFQASQWNQPERAEFTVNLLVVMPSLHEAYCNAPFPKNPGSAVALVQQRLGTLVEGRDQWWEVNPGTRAADMGSEISALLEKRGLPFLSQFTSAAGLLRMYDEGVTLPGVEGNHGRAHVLLLTEAGRRAEAETKLNAMLCKSKVDGFSESLRSFAKVLGLTTESV